jgi:hypothetical protein
MDLFQRVFICLIGNVGWFVVRNSDNDQYGLFGIWNGFVPIFLVSLSFICVRLKYVMMCWLLVLRFDYYFFFVRPVFNWLILADFGPNVVFLACCVIGYRKCVASEKATSVAAAKQS